MTVCLLLCFAGFVSLVFYVREKLRACSVKALILKSIVSVLFIAVGFFALYSNSSPAGFFVLGGLVCGILGDIWLDLKYIYPADDAPYTFSGFVSFAVGHVLFIGGMLLDFGGLITPAAFLITAVASVALGFATVLSGPLMKLDYGKFKGISMLYGPLLFATALVSFVLARAAGFESRGLIMMFVGGVLFALSDLVLSGTYFGVGRDRPVDIILNYAFYYGAQFTIAMAILFF